VNFRKLLFKYVMFQAHDRSDIVLKSATNVALT